MAAKEKDVSFEGALNELEQIAEDSIKAYERGMDLKKICTERLKEAEGKIEFLAKSPDGKIVKENAIREPKEKEKDKKPKEEILF